jgi:hypothetical protein
MSIENNNQLFSLLLNEAFNDMLYLLAYHQKNKSRVGSRKLKKKTRRFSSH